MERAVGPLDTAIVLFLHRRIELLLTLDNDRAVLDRDVDVLARQARELRAKHQVMLLRFVDVDRRHPASAEASIFITQVDIAEQTVQAVLHRRKFPKRINLDNRHCSSPPVTLPPEGGSHKLLGPGDAYASTTSPSFTSVSPPCDADDALAAFACD